jgi:mannose-6-phosphate isomerase-like protein (cupin superfamily)
MTKLFELKDAIQIKTRWEGGKPKETIPTDYEGIYSRPHSTGKGKEYRLVNPTMGPKRMGVSLITLEPNIKTTAGIHSHENMETAYIVLHGNATLHLNGTEHHLKPNTVAFIPPGVKHGMTGTGNKGVTFLNVQVRLDTETQAK